MESQQINEKIQKGETNYTLFSYYNIWTGIDKSKDFFTINIINADNKKLLYEYIVSLNGDIIRNSLPIEPLKLNKKSSFQYLLIGRKNNEDKRRNLKNNIFLPAKDQNTSRFHCKLKVENCSLFLFDSIKYIKAQALGQYLKKKGWNIPYSRSLIHFLNF